MRKSAYLSAFPMDMNGFANRFLWLLVGLMMTTAVFAQGGDPDRKEELRIRKVRLQDDIQIVNRILEDARQHRRTSLSALQTLNQKLRIREELLRTIDREIVLIDREIEEQEAEIEALRAEIDTLKAKYAGMIRQAYKSRSRSGRLQFVLSSRDFAQAIRRIQYLRQYSNFRQQQVNQIAERQAELEHQIELLNRQKEEKESLRNEKQIEREELMHEQEDQQQLIAELQTREGDLEAQIRNKQSEVDRLEGEIQRIIAEEIRRERARAERNRLEERALQVGLVKGQDFNARTTNARLTELIEEKRRATSAPAETATPEPAYALTPEAARLARNFEANKGNLPWPVERGVIVGRFGRQPHPANRSIIINNPHIEIGTQSGSEARAAFAGTVLHVIRIQGAPITVIVQHGNYYTHYGNLSEAYVKDGETIEARQALGKILTDPDDNQTVLQFGLWKNDQLEDPAPWLAR